MKKFCIRRLCLLQDDELGEGDEEDLKDQPATSGSLGIEVNLIEFDCVMQKEPYLLVFSLSASV